MYLRELQNQDPELDAGCLQTDGHIILGEDAPDSTHTERTGRGSQNYLAGRRALKIPGYSGSKYP